MPSPEAGKSSFDLVDRDALLAALPRASLRRVLDLGCGSGAYTLWLARCLGSGRTIHGVDAWAEGISVLRAQAQREGLRNVTAQVGDLTEPNWGEGGKADLALMATVLHDLVPRGDAPAVLRETCRALAPTGWLAVVEFKKAETPRGPPARIRLSPGDLSGLVQPFGFGPPSVVDLGANLYLAVFPRTAGCGSEREAK